MILRTLSLGSLPECIKYYQSRLKTGKCQSATFWHFCFNHQSFYWVPVIRLNFSLGQVKFVWGKVECELNEFKLADSKWLEK